MAQVLASTEPGAVIEAVEATFPEWEIGQTLEGYLALENSAPGVCQRSLAEIGYPLQELGHMSLEGFFQRSEGEDYQYLNEITSTNNPSEQLVASRAFHCGDRFAINSVMRMFNDGSLNCEDLCPPEGPDRVTGFVMTFGRSEGWSIMLDIGPEQRQKLENLHALGARSFEMLLGNPSSTDPAHDAMKAVIEACEKADIAFTRINSF